MPSWVSLPRVDFVLLGLVLAVIATGLAVLYSASGQDAVYVERQAVRIAVGLLAMLVFSQVPPHVLRIWTPWLYAIAIVMVAATWFFGIGRNTQRWLDLGVVRFQPSELMKLAVPMAVAAFLHQRILPPGWKDTLVALLILAVPTFLIIRQPDLGTALLVASSGAFTLFLAGIRWRTIALAGVAGIALAPVLWMFMEEYQRNRVRTFLDP
ncbi:MAG: FtsW/RodA/SpoVE family cell cycle protein, partial [Gammaproteobacteria bacterium]|nr:FtsW/RodA/SpoVE family cell cycle protein [Gammaproteobacteria bacterium]